VGGSLKGQSFKELRKKEERSDHFVEVGVRDDFEEGSADKASNLRLSTVTQGNLSNS